MKRVLTKNDDTTTVFHCDELTDEIVIQRTQNVAPIIEDNKRLQTMNDGYSPSRELKRVASIPLAIFESWLIEDGLDWSRYWQMGKKEQAAYRARRLLSSDYRDLLTS